MHENCILVLFHASSAIYYSCSRYLSDWIIPNRLIVLLEASDGVGSEREGEVVAGPVDVTGGEGGQLSPDPLTPTLPRFPSLLFCS